MTVADCPRVRPALLALPLLFSAAQGQAQVVLSPLQLTTSDGQSTYTFGAAACTTTLQATWTNNSLFGAPCGDLAVWTTSGECGDTPASGDHSLDSVTAAIVMSVRTGTIQVPLEQLPGFTGADAGLCGAADTQLSMKLCAAIPLQSGLTCFSNHASPLELDYDTQPPPAPAIDSVVAQDGALQVSVSASTDTFEVDLQAQGAQETAFGHGVQVLTADTSTGTIRGLTNGEAYEVRAYAVDAAGNASGYSDPMSGTPLHSTGFWEAYRRAGGEAQGCTSFPSGQLAWLALLARLAGRSRRRR